MTSHSGDFPLFRKSAHTLGLRLLGAFGCMARSLTCFRPISSAEQRELQQARNKNGEQGARLFNILPDVFVFGLPC